MSKVIWQGQAVVRSLGAVDPTGQPWNNYTYNYCIGPAIQNCGQQFANQPELLQQCIDNEQAKCIQKAKNAPTLDKAGVIALQKKINAALAQYGYCPIGVDGDLGPETCGAAGWAVKTDPSITVPSYCNTVKPVLNLKDCSKPGGGGGGGVIPTECSDNKPCPTGKECFGGKCLDKCPTGYTRDAAGLCQPPQLSTGGASEIPWGVVALAGAAAVGLFFALRPPKDLAAPENRLGDNPWYGEPVRHSRAAKKGWAQHCPARCCAARRKATAPKGPGIALGAFAAPKSATRPAIGGVHATALAMSQHLKAKQSKLANNPCGCDECECEG